MALQYLDAARVLSKVLGEESAPSAGAVSAVNNAVQDNVVSGAGEAEEEGEEVADARLTVRAALYAVQASSQAHLPVVHALVLNTLTYMGPLTLVLNAVCAQLRKVAGSDPLLALWQPKTRHKSSNNDDKSNETGHSDNDSKTNKKKRQNEHRGEADARVVLLVMCADLLFGQRRVSGSGRVRRVLLAHQAALESEAVRLRVRAKAADDRALVPHTLRDMTPLPRYARVNTLVHTPSDVLRSLANEGFTRVTAEELFAHVDADPWSNVSLVAVDEDVCDGDLLVFPPLVDLHAHALVLGGALVLQQKASTLSGWLLRAPPGSSALDACAAPGMKTSQLAASMCDSGALFAVDRSARRLETLSALAARHRMTHTTPVHASFLDLDPRAEPYAHVQYLLCDPSCSGSGISSRGDDLVAYARFCASEPALTLERCLAYRARPLSRARLESLAAFQVRVVAHALSFPKATRVVYSTCSVHWIENEEVVLRLLRDHGDTWTLENTLPTWSRRGFTHRPPPSEEEDECASVLGEEECAALCARVPLERCVRTLREDRTIGFFVAVFVRKDAQAKHKREKTAQKDREGARERGDANDRERKRGEGKPRDGDAARVERKKVDAANAHEDSKRKRAESTTEEARPLKAARTEERSTPSIAPVEEAQRRESEVSRKPASFSFAALSK